MNAPRETIETQQEPAGVLIVHLEYESVQEAANCSAHRGGSRVSRRHCGGRIWC
jgi:hypothetical protein